jgi:hypothetical protein
MRCRNCEYSLWTVTGRTCPECGAPFRPSEFVFPPQSVRFECPHCRAGYVGTSAEGHLVPRGFECGECHRQIDMDEMILSPIGAMDEATEMLTNNPWAHRRSEAGGLTIVHWFRAWTSVIFRPGRFASTLRRNDSTKQAWIFAIYGWSFAAAIVFLLALLLVSVTSLPLTPLGQGMFGAGATADIVLSATLFAVGGFFGLVVLAVLVALTHHVAAYLLIPNRGPFGATLHATLYASGATACVFLLGDLAPGLSCLCLPLVAAAWFVPTTVLLGQLHRTTTMRALLVSSAPVLLIMLGCGCWIGGTVWFLAARVGPMMGQMTPAPVPAGATAAFGEQLPYQVEAISSGGQTANPFIESIAGAVTWAELRDAITEEGSRSVAIDGVEVGAVGANEPEKLTRLGASFTKRVSAGQPYRIGSLIVYRPLSNGTDFNAWSSIWRKKDGTYFVATMLQQYTMDATALEAYFQSESARRKALDGTVLPHPNSIPNLADTSDPFMVVPPSTSTSDPNAGPVAPQEPGEEEEPAGDELDAQADPDAG